MAWCDGGPDHPISSCNSTDWQSGRDEVIFWSHSINIYKKWAHTTIFKQRLCFFLSQYSFETFKRWSDDSPFTNKGVLPIWTSTNRLLLDFWQRVFIWSDDSWILTVKSFQEPSGYICHPDRGWSSHVTNLFDAWWAASYVTPRAGVSVPHLPASHGRSEARHDRGRRDSRTTGRDQAVASSSPTREHQCIADMRETFKCSYMTHCIRVKHFVTKSCALEKCSY